MNILFLCHRLPYPPNKGDKIRSFNVLTHLLKDHTVYLGTFVDEAADRQYVSAVERLVGVRAKILDLPPWLRNARMLLGLLSGAALSTASYKDRRLKRWIDDLIRNNSIDRVVIFGSAMAPYLLDTPAYPGSSVILDMVDIDSDKWNQYADNSRGAFRYIYRREAQRLFALEKRAVGTFGASLLVSEFEKHSFITLAPEARHKLHVSCNGVDLEYFSPHTAFHNPFPPTETPIVLTGQMDYRPNIEGALWFAKEVLPLVQVRIPTARFYVVGAEPSAALRSFSNKSVVVTGSVPDIRPFVSHASVVVAPLKIARGVQNKVLEAMAMQKPVVGTTPATRAINVTSGVELWIADDKVSFSGAVADAVLGLGAADIALRARRHVERHYSWDHNLTILDNLFDHPSSLGKSTRGPEGAESAMGHCSGVTAL